MSTHKPSYFSTILSLSFVLIMDAMVMGIVFPLMGALFINPHQAIVPLHTSLWMRDILYSLTMGIFFFCVIIGAPFLGDLSDVIGRRKVLLLSLVIGGLSCLLAAAAITYKLVWLLIVARAIAGLAAGNQPLAQAAMIDISTPETKARNISLIMLASCTGFAFGPLVGGVFSDAGLFSFFTPAVPFMIAAAFAFITAIAVGFTFKETFIPSGHKKLHISKGFTLLIEGFRHVKLRQWIWVLLLGQLAWGIYFQSVSLILSQFYHYTTGKIGLFMTYLAILFAIGTGLVVPQSLKKFELVPLLKVGFFIAILSMGVGIVFIHSMLMQWLNLILVVLGEVFIYTVTMTMMSNTVDRDSQGWVMGVAAAVGSLAWGVAAFVAGTVSFSLYLPLISALIFFSAGLYLTSRHQ